MSRPREAVPAQEDVRTTGRGRRVVRPRSGPATAAADRTRRGGAPLAGTGTLLRLALRRDRLMLPAWVLALGLSVLATSSALEKFYGTAAERAGLVRSMTADASLRSLYGPVFDASLGGLTAWRMVGFGGGLAAVMSLVIVVRHTRDEEESGRQELLSAAVVGRHAPLTAALLAAAVANLALAALVTAGLAGSGLPWRGALALGLALAGCGLAFAGVGAVTAQLCESGRAAKGLAGAAVGAAFVLRAAGDAASTAATSPLTWLSPLGWGEHLRAFAGERWPVLLLFLAAACLTCAAAYGLTARRDLGTGLWASRPGPARASARLAGPIGLAWRLQRGGLLGWVLAFAATGAIFGALTDGAADLVGGSGQTRDIVTRMGGHQGITDAFVSVTVGLLGTVATLHVVGAVARLHAEEASGRAEAVLAGSVSRLRWAAGHLSVAFLGSTLVLAAGGLTLGLGYGISTGDPLGRCGPPLLAVLAQVPAVWVLAGVATLLLGVAPAGGDAQWLGWVAAAFVLAVGWLGQALRLPQAVLDLSPFTHLPKLPGGTVSATPFLWLAAVTVTTTAAGLLALRRRDVG
ncbi:ABC transporter permease [Streptomyces sp. NPDC059740]|uniref:ABC transporter permease n=1 Tax=Streptomyces sp. NPDC059740 TaxID=3346926 RepID=UPI003663A8D6